jgi:hypothetical protein
VVCRFRADGNGLFTARQYARDSSLPASYQLCFQTTEVEAAVTISYYDDDTRAPITASGPLTFLMLTNAVIALTVLFAWTAVSLYIVEPIAWATWMPVRRGTSFEELFEYPFVLLWLLPAAGIGGAWLSLRTGRRGAAFLCAIAPIAFLGLIFGWFYLAPPTYR